MVTPSQNIDQRPLHLLIGGGLSGLSLARELKRAGVRWALIDKGRGWGGRLATRRSAEGGFFDHGAPELHLSQATVSSLLNRWSHLDLRPSHHQSPQRPAWVPGDQNQAFEGMSRLPKQMAAELAKAGTDASQLRLQVRATSLSETSGGDLRVSLEDGSDVVCRHIYISCPIEQAVQLLATVMAIPKELAELRCSPCLCLLLILKQTDQILRWTELEKRETVSRSFSNSQAVDRKTGVHWTLQMASGFSAQAWSMSDEARVELIRAQIGSQLWADVLDVQLKAWRYAQVERGTSEPFWTGQTKGGATITLFGDAFAGGQGAESALSSAWSVAQRVLDQ